MEYRLKNQLNDDEEEEEDDDDEKKEDDDDYCILYGGNLFTSIVMETKRLEMAFEFWSVGKVIVGVGLMMSSFLGLVIHLTTYKADTDTPTEKKE